MQSSNEGFSGSENDVLAITFATGLRQTKERVPAARSVRAAAVEAGPSVVKNAACSTSLLSVAIKQNLQPTHVAVLGSGDVIALRIRRTCSANDTTVARTLLLNRGRNATRRVRELLQQGTRQFCEARAN
eukprot:4398478-Pleurochrysis_carterae.AAC.2